MIDEEQIRKVINEELNKRETLNAFNVNMIPFHEHTGIDSPSINISNTIGLVNNNWGIFRWTTLFESTDGYTKTSGSAVATGEQLTLTSVATAGTAAYVMKQPLIQTIMDYDSPNRFRTTFQLGAVTSQTVYIVVGDTAGDYYGYKIVDNILYAVTADAVTETTSQMRTLSATTNYNLEARFYPKKQVDYLIDDGLRTTIRTNLPNTVDVAQTYPMDVQITPSANSARSISLSYWDFLQETDLALR